MSELMDVDPRADVPGDEEHPPSDEGEGDNIGPGASDDSSEEEATDEEEAVNIRKGFIVDDDDDEEGEEERIHKSRRKRRRRRQRSESLDADDLALVEENTGTRVNRSRSQHLSRIRRGRASVSPPPRPSRLADDVSDAESLPSIDKIFDDRGRAGPQDVEDMDMEDDFIDDDDDDLDGDMNDEEREELRRRRKTEAMERRLAISARPQMAGIGQAEWDEIYDVFGAGAEYKWALDEDELSGDEEGPKEMRYQDVFEPSEIAARYLTAEDDVIRANDIPERMQLTGSTLSSSATLSPHINDGPFPQSEMASAAEWVSFRLSERIQRDFFYADGKYNSYLSDLILAVTKALEFILQDQLEVPYIWTHKRDWISSFKPEKQLARVELLSREELWRIGVLGARYRAIYTRRTALEATYARMGVSDAYFEADLMNALDSVDVAADILEWFSMHYKQQYRNAVELEGDEGDAHQRRKKPSRVSQYDVAKDHVVSGLAVKFGIPSHEIVQNALSNTKMFETQDPDLPPLQLAEEFCDDSPGINTPEDALRTARFIIATELGRDPQLRKLARNQFKTGAVISVKPTEKGGTKIDDLHPYAGFKYLRDKPVVNFLKNAQFLQILQAEADHLVTVTITLAASEISTLQNRLDRAFKSDGFSDVSNAWNIQRSLVVEEVIEKHLFPVGVKFIREWLKEESEEQLANRCADALEKDIDVAPYHPEGFDKNDVPSVLALSFGKGDANKDPIIAVVLDEAGRLREHARFENLIDSEPRQDFLSLIERRKPDVIAVGAFSIFGLRLMERVNDVLGYETVGPTGEPEWQTRGSDPMNVPPPTDSEDAPKRRIPVTWVKDRVARIYQNSKRAEEEFGTLPPVGRYCIALARYVQSPLNEYAALGSDLVAISFNPDQHLLPTDALLLALERTLVNIVNDVGVDINRAMTDSYYALTLPFVAGLGPRKAQAIVKRIAANGGTMLNREQFITQSIMTAQIFINAAGFLRIAQDPYENTRSRRDDDRAQDPLDSTRIHPEDYELARKMATDALELDEEDVAHQHPSEVVAQIMQDDDNQKKLDDLSLDEFAISLRESSKEEKRHTLDMIHNELLNPFGEHRQPFEPLSRWDIITMLTGETPDTLRSGRIITVMVQRVHSKDVEVKLDSGITGYILRNLLSSTNAEPSSLVQPRQSLQAVINGEVNFLSPGLQIRVALAAAPEAIQQATERAATTHRDAYYDSPAAGQALELQQRKQRSEASRSRRVVKHPAFKNLNARQAEEYLAPLQHGDAVIRPSSKGADHLAVTWKVSDGVFQHIDVVESNPDGAQGDAVNLFNVDGKYVYVDLDDLLVNHVKAMARKADDLMAHEKYKGDTPTELQSYLMNFVKMNPTRSAYAFGLNRQRPGFFNLSFLPNANSPIQTWLVKVTPTAYRLAEVEVGSVPDLCDAFKRKHQKDLKSMSSNAKTPYGAGRMTPGRGATPARLPGGVTPGRVPMGMTPGYGTSYGRTPNPHAQGPFNQPPPMPFAQPAFATTPFHNPPPMTPAQPPGGPGPVMNPERMRMLQDGFGGTPRR